MPSSDAARSAAPDAPPALPPRDGPWTTRAWAWAKTLVANWSEDECGTRAASLSFYTAFSLAPILVLVSIVASLFLDSQAVRDALVDQASGLVGSDGADLLSGMLDRASRPGQGFSAVFATVLLVAGATTAFAQLKDSLDKIFDVPAAAGGGLWSTIRTRLLSFGLVLTLAFLLLVSLAAGAAFAGLSGAIASRFGWAEMWLGRVLALVVSLAGSFALFFVVFWLLPGRRPPIRPLLLGAAVTTVLFAIGRVLIGLYLANNDAVAAFGAAGSLAIVLLWVDYSALVFFAGAEIAYLIDLAMTRQAGARTPAYESPTVATAGAAAMADEIAVAEDRVGRARARLATHAGDAVAAMRPRLFSPPMLVAATVAAGGYLLGRRTRRD